MMIKFIKYILLVIVGLLICDFSISFVIEKLMKNRYDPIIYSTYNNQSDIAILGASRAAHHYVPSVIEDSLHLIAANYGIDGQNIFTQYVVLNSLIKHSKHKPKIVISEISAIDINDTPKWNTEKLNILYPYFYSDECVRNLLFDVLDPGEFLALRIFGLYRHNSNYLSYLKSLLFGFPPASDGYRPLTKIWDKSIEYEEEHGNTFHEKKLKYLEKFISLCRKEDIRLIIAVSPNYNRLPEQKWVNKIKEITRKNSIPFLYHETDTLYHNHREWFNEPFHLNDEGAKVYTKQICREIRDI